MDRKWTGMHPYGWVDVREDASFYIWLHMGPFRFIGPNTISLSPDPERMWVDIGGTQIFTSDFQLGFHGSVFLPSQDGAKMEQTWMSHISILI